MAKKRSSIIVAVALTSVFWILMICLFVALPRHDPVGDGGPVAKKSKRDSLFAEVDGLVVFRPPKGHKSNSTAPNIIFGDMESTSPEVGPKKKKTKEERVKDGYSMYGFNKVASDAIALDRDIPDTRHPKCKKRKYPSDLPTCSVVLIFHNEAWSVLLRSVHSLLRRTPPHLLKEVILVDDFSTRRHLGKKLDDYVATLGGKVHVVRQKARMGLTRSRMAGAAVAIGDIVVFLDCHIEANVGWYEPMAARIHTDRTIVVCPTIDVINQDNFNYEGVHDAFVMGSFNWNLIFKWRGIPPRIRREDVKDETSEFRSPTMAGGLFAMSRSYFNDLGKYDYEMDIWGSENLELSFRIWQCGGRLEIVPCSRVGHVYRRRSPISFPKGVEKTTTRNALRLAEVWLDDYKDIYYRMRPDARGRDYGDISDRVALRRRLGCKSFQWFLDKVFPEQHVPLEKNMLAWGEIRNPDSALCLDSLGKNDGGPKMGIYQCHGQGGNQAFWYTKEKEIRREDNCLDASQRIPNAPVILLECHELGGNQYWEHRNNEVLYHTGTDQCLDRATANSGEYVVMNVCDGRASQKWKFGVYRSDKFGTKSPL